MYGKLTTSVKDDPLEGILAISGIELTVTEPLCPIGPEVPPPFLPGRSNASPPVDEDNGLRRRRLQRMDTELLESEDSDGENCKDDLAFSNMVKRHIRRRKFKRTEDGGAQVVPQN